MSCARVSWVLMDSNEDEDIGGNLGICKWLNHHQELKLINWLTSLALQSLLKFGMENFKCFSCCNFGYLAKILTSNPEHVVFFFVGGHHHLKLNCQTLVQGVNPSNPLRPSACFRRQMCAEGGEGRSAEGEVVKLIRLVDPSRSYRVLNGVYIPLDPEQPLEK